MRFIIYNFSDVFGGQEKYLESVINQLIKRDHQITLIGGPKELGENIDSKFIPCSNKLFSYPSKDIRDHDVIILNGNRSFYKYLTSFNVFNKTPTVYIQHSNFFDSQAGIKSKYLRIGLFRLFINRVDTVIRVSESSFPESFFNGTVNTIYNGIDTNRYKPDPKTKSSENEILNLLMVGALTKNKNHIDALRVLKSYKKYKLKIIGKGPNEDYLKEYVSKNDLSNQVEFVGYVDDPVRYYQLADLCLMLSQNEGLPFVVLESMACATPVVSYDVGGIPEVINSGIDGFILSKNNSNELSKILNFIITNSYDIKNIGANARNKIENDHSLNSMVTKLEACFREISDK